MRSSSVWLCGIVWILTACDSGNGASHISCTSDRQCSAAGMVCDVATATCVQCNSATDCSASQICRAGACADVVACVSSRSCPGQVCDPTLQYCVDCVDDVDCASGQVCREGTCVTPPPSCTSDRACSGMGLVCDTSAQLCVECNTGADCAMGMSCSASHTCVVGLDRDAGMADAFVPRDAGPPFVIAPHGAGPIVEDQGGPRMPHPQIVVLTYDDDAYRSTEEANAQWLVSSSWLTTVGAEYGIGAGSVLGNIHLGTSPTALSSDDIESLLANGVGSHAYPRSADGTLDQVIYFLYLPARTVVTDSFDHGMSCVDFNGYHSSATTSSGERFTFAVIDTCPMPGDRTLTSIESTEITVSHELIEAATDPLPVAAPGLEIPGSSLSPWLLVGGELADLCELNAGTSAYVRYPPYVTTRIWSNAAAQSNDRDPCVPSDAAPYYSISVTPSMLQDISPGGTVTFDLAAWSTGTVPTWRLDAMASGRTFTPTVSIDRPSVNNGSHATLTIRAPTGLASGDYALVWLYLGVPSDPSTYQTLPIGVYVP